jgi:hypothetical protein
MKSLFELWEKATGKVLETTGFQTSFLLQPIDLLTNSLEAVWEDKALWLAEVSLIV